MKSFSKHWRQSTAPLFSYKQCKIVNKHLNSKSFIYLAVANNVLQIQLLNVVYDFILCVES